MSVYWNEKERDREEKESIFFSEKKDIGKVFKVIIYSTAMLIHRKKSNGSKWYNYYFTNSRLYSDRSLGGYLRGLRIH